jgi:phiKZ-like phage internal head proteins
MSKRFNIRLSLESKATESVVPPENGGLNVDKEATLTPEEIAIRDKAKAEENPPEDKKTEISDEEKNEGIPEDEPEESATDVSKEIEEDSEDQATAVESIITLERLAEIITSTKDNNGLALQSAKVSSLAIENIRQRVGFKPGNKEFPALESFNSYSQRDQATQLALENIKETISKIWESISNSLQKISRKISVALAIIAYNCKNNLEKIKALRYDIINNFGNVSNNVDYGVVSHIARLSLGGVFDPLASIEAYNDLSSTYENSISGAGTGNLKFLYQSFRTDNPKLVKLYLNGEITSCGGKLVTDSHNSTINVYEKELPNNQLISSSVPRMDLGIDDYVDSLIHASTSILNSSNTSFPQVVKSAKKEDLLEILTRAEHLIDQILRNRAQCIKVLNSTEFKYISKLVSRPNDNDTSRNMEDSDKTIIHYVIAFENVFLRPAVAIGNNCDLAVNL